MSQNLAAALILVCASLPACMDRGAFASPPPAETAAAPSAVASSSASPLAQDAGDLADASIADASIADASIEDAAVASADASAPEPPCPAEMARIGRSCVDRWEAHLVVPDAGGALVPHPHTERPPSGVRYEARSDPGFFPQGYISQVESANACQNAGKRLCSMQEWSRACEGPRRTKYPYGHRFAQGRCNSGKAHLLQRHFGSSSRSWKYDEHFNNPMLNAEPGFLAKTGEYERCAGEEGVLDLVGNLHEWVRDHVDADLVEKLEGEDVERHHQPWREGNGVFMGGFFSTNAELGPGCKYITIAHEPSYHDYSTGFRCCADARLPPPARRTKKR